MINKIIRNKNINYYITNIIISITECIQNTILVWIVFNYTNSSYSISLISFCNYFPMIISVFTFISIIDNINPLFQNYINNIFSLIISFFMFLLLFIKPKINIFLILLFILQISFSFIRTLNKINFNKISKILFKKNSRDKTYKILLSLIQISQTIGNIIGSLFIAQNIPLFGFISACFIYFITLFLSYYLWKKYKNIFVNKIENNRIKINISLFRYLFRNKKLFIILMFSIPSSGLFQYLMVTLPFLTKIIKLKSNYSYSILSFCCTFFSSIIGFILYNDLIFNLIKNYTFIVCSILLSILIFNKNFVLLLLINSICFGLLAGHIICMQIEMNKFSSYLNLGKYTIIRNCLSSLSKILFSLTSIYFINNFSLSFVYIFGSVILLLFQIIYFLFNRLILI